MILDEIAKHTLRFFVATVTVFMILFYIAMSLLEGVSLLYGHNVQNIKYKWYCLF
jgi:hypothetical protein